VNAGAARLMRGQQELAANEDVFPFRAQWVSATEFIYTADGKIKRRTLTPNAPSTSIAFTATLTITPASYTRKKRDFNATTAKPSSPAVFAPVASMAKEIVLMPLTAWMT